MKTQQTILAVFLLLMTGCSGQELASTVRQSLDADTIWVHAHFNVPEKEGVEDYYYFGRISKELYQQILDGKKEKGFILLRDVRYWNTDDEIVKYEDHVDAGHILFRIENLMKLVLEKGDPYILENKNTEEKTTS